MECRYTLATRKKIILVKIVLQNYLEFVLCYTPLLDVPEIKTTSTNIIKNIIYLNLLWKPPPSVKCKPLCDIYNIVSHFSVYFMWLHKLGDKQTITCVIAFMLMSPFYVLFTADISYYRICVQLLSHWCLTPKVVLCHARFDLICCLIVCYHIDVLFKSHRYKFCVYYIVFCIYVCLLWMVESTVKRRQTFLWKVGKEDGQDKRWGLLTVSGEVTEGGESKENERKFLTSPPPLPGNCSSLTSPLSYSPPHIPSFTPSPNIPPASGL